MTTHHNNTDHNNTYNGNAHQNNAHHDSTDRCDGHTASPAMPALVRTTVHVAQLATPPPAGFTATSITATSITTTGGTTTGGTVGSDPVDQVIAALQGLEHAYATVITQLDPDPASGFDPARGSTPIIFALLDLTDLHPGHPTDHTPAPHPPAPQPPAQQSPACDGERPAQQWLRDLLNQAADTVLTASQDPATPPRLTPLLADIMAALSTAHTLTFNTSW